MVYLRLNRIVSDSSISSQGLRERGQVNATAYARATTNIVGPSSLNLRIGTEYPNSTLRIGYKVDIYT